MLRALRESLVFLGQFGSRFQTTGSILPSSRFLAKAITSQLRERGDNPVRILECGPGTGPFTDAIIHQMQDGDTFDLVELNHKFVEVLNKRFETDPAWNARKSQIEIHEIPLQEFPADQPYDFIISGIPHVNLPGELVRSITDTYFRLLKPDGVLSYFEYALIRPIRAKLTFGKDGKRIRAVNEIMDSHCSARRIRRDTVLLNVPPAWAQHLSGTARSDSQ